MTNHGDDCYFYYYSTCTKGDSCPFRHCEAAIGNEIVCNLWEEGRCFRPMCKFRHFQITHNRKEIACYWENQPAGCQKPHCAFFHEKPRYIDGMFVPPDKGVKKIEEVPQEEPVPVQPTLPTAANPQVRGVKKTESQEPVPSPTHPPVVINAADDDEDEDDQFSEEGESPRKQPGGPKSEGSLNFGVSTLEEIRLRRALKASMKRAMYSFPVGDACANGGKENIQSSFRLMGDAEEDVVPVRRSLAERLGRVVDEKQPASQRSSKSVKQRLQLPPELMTEDPSATKSVKQRLRLPPEMMPEELPVEIKSKKPEQIRIKTLEEIKQEKAAKSRSQKDSSDSENTITKTVTAKSTRGIKRAITVKDNSIGNVRTFSEILHAKKKRLEEEQSVKKPLSEKSKDKSQVKSEAAASQANESVGQIKVKTLEEIRREKAARLQAQDTQEPQQKSPEPQEAKKPRLLRLKKVTSQSQDIAQKNGNVTEKPEEPLQSAATPAPQESSGNSIKVKTFEEIMREKRLRKQDAEEQPKPTADVEPPPQKLPSPPLKRKVPAKISFTPDSSTAPESVVHPAEAAPAPVTAVASADSEADSQPQKPVSKATASPSKTTSPRTRTNVQTSKETKVKPKLNVKPSVVKPTAQLKPGQKRKAPQRSAVAAVKPLNSSAKQRTDTQVSSVSSDSAQSSDFLCTVTSSDSACKPSPLPLVSEPPAPDTSTVTQSRSLKSPTPGKSRRSSVAASRNSSSSTAPTSAVDEFEDLISEFTTDDALGDSVDPGLGEDDLLQELSEMIDS